MKCICSIEYLCLNGCQCKKNYMVGIDVSKENEEFSLFLEWQHQKLIKWHEYFKKFYLQHFFIER